MEYHKHDAARGADLGNLPAGIRLLQPDGLQTFQSIPAQEVVRAVSCTVA